MPIPALILAGGLGTRLKHLIPDIPKPMANVAGKPFLYYLLKQLQVQGIKEVYISIGYKAEKISSYFQNNFHSLRIHYIKEEEPLGTGGAIAYALNQIPYDKVLILNGDTFLNLDITKFINEYEKNNLTLALKYVQQSNRYGFVDIQNNTISGFAEKSSVLKDGWINAGVYLLNKHFFLSNIPSQKVFSFERDFLEKIIHKYPVQVFKVNDYFIDIGIPVDYHQAQKDFASLKHLNINHSWTLFLDRDGVINKKLENDYVKTIAEFEWLENVVDALKILRQKFGRIIIVTNQQGIGKGLMTEEDLNKIHEHLLNTLAKENIIIDKIYYAPQLESMKSIMRKPNIGMALKAKEDFQDIDFSKSIMIGDSLSDMQFAHNAGMYAVYLTNKDELHIPFDFKFRDLFDFAKCFSE
ncbi:MAG: hypothetical protein KatS3mg027_0683 [Bacteroidia bacterium]|nr:MAG: hypothetical protein KatS3mg027_0683 [Bacteroidia bacterium]